MSYYGRPALSPAPSSVDPSPVHFPLSSLCTAPFSSPFPKFTLHFPYTMRHALEFSACRSGCDSPAATSTATPPFPPAIPFLPFATSTFDSQSLLCPEQRWIAESILVLRLKKKKKKQFNNFLHVTRKWRLEEAMYLSEPRSCNTRALPCYHVYKLQLIFPLARSLTH